MKAFLGRYFYVFLTILMATYSQITLKYQMQKVGDLPPGFFLKIMSMIKLILTNFYIFSAYGVSLIASLCWLLALKSVSLNVAYPLLSFSFVTVCLTSSIVFKEKIHLPQMLGILLILFGSYLVNVGQEHATHSI